MKKDSRAEAEALLPALPGFQAFPEEVLEDSPVGARSLGGRLHSLRLVLGVEAVEAGSTQRIQTRFLSECPNDVARVIKSSNLSQADIW